MAASALAVLQARLGAALTHAAPGRPAADRLCAACVELLDVDEAAISMVHDGFSHGTYGASGAASRQLDEYQFTFGEGPCLDAAATSEAVLVADLNAPSENRWPAFTGAALGDGIQAVFALPIMVTSMCVGALDLFRRGPGPMTDDALAGGNLAAALAALPLLDLMGSVSDGVVGSDGSTQGWLTDLDRVEVYQATGMLISQLDVGAAEALVRLRAHAISTGQTATEVGWAIIERRLVLDRDPKVHREGSI